MRRRTVTGRRTAAAWRALLNGSAGSELPVPQYCAREGISAEMPQPTAFVDMGALATPNST